MADIFIIICIIVIYLFILKKKTYIFFFLKQRSLLYWYPETNTLPPTVGFVIWSHDSLLATIPKTQQFERM